MNESIVCFKCSREWPKESEQGVSVELHSECAVCKFTQGCGSNNGTKEELEFIRVESLKRRKGKM